MGSSCYLGTPLFVSPIEDALVRRVMEMGRELEALRMRSERPYELDFNTASAFTSKIMEQPVLLRFKMPQTELYDNSVDPLDHLEAFKALMLLYGANDRILCQAFSTTLRKVAQQWFSNLQPRSISSLEQLGRLFITHFISSQR